MATLGFQRFLQIRIKWVGVLAVLCLAVPAFEVPSLTSRTTPEKTLVAGRAGWFAVSTDGKLFAAVKPVYRQFGTPHFSCDFTILTADGRVVRTWTKAMTSSPALAFSPDGSILAGGSSKTQTPIFLWDTASGRLLRRIPAKPWIINDLAFSPDGKMLATSAQLIRVRDGTALEQLSNTQGSAVAYSPDGTLVATGSCDHAIKLWNPAGGPFVRKLNAHGFGVTALAFSPNGQFLAATQTTVPEVRRHPHAADTKIYLWRVLDGALVREMEGPHPNIADLAFSQDGSLLAAGCDQKVVVWNVETGRQKWELTGACRPVAFMPHSGLLATGNEEDGIELWRVKPAVSTTK